VAKRTILISSYSVCIIFASLVLIAAEIGQGQTTDASAAIDAAKARVVSYIGAGKLTAADSAVVGIMEMPASQEKGLALQQIAGVYQRAKEYDRAIKTCDYVMRNWPKENFAVWAGMSKALSQMSKGDMTAAEKTTERIVNDYASDVNLPQALSIIADGYSGQNMDDKAAKLREFIIDKSPESMWGAQAQILSFINKNGYSAAQKRLNSMVADFNNHPKLSEIVFRIGQEFCWKRKYVEAKNAFDHLINDVGDKSLTPKAKLWSGMANACALIRQGKDEEANAAIDKLIKDSDGDAGLPEVVYHIGQEFEWTKADVVSDSSQYNFSANIYSQLLTSFSDTPYGKLADWDYRRLVDRMNILSLIEKGDQTGAEGAVDKMVTELAGRPELPGELSWMARWSYEHHKNDILDKLDEKIITEFPNSATSGASFWRMVSTIIEADEDANKSVDDTIAELKKQFAGNPEYTTLAIGKAGDVYLEKAEKENLPRAVGTHSQTYLQKAIRLFTEARQTADPNSQFAADCLDSISKCNEQLRNQTQPKSSVRPSK
jgi:outer membrane protein assembly factor BamD (BamD/ComL family)